MTNRSANATIKGYFYQFDHAIFQLLSLSDGSQTITVEGIEDVDISSTDFEQLIQCKYYEQSEYNHSVIKPAIIEMLKHFKVNQCSTKFKYKLYGHYKSGQEKLDLPLTNSYLKQNFLKYEEKGIYHEVWNELPVSDLEIDIFISCLEVDNKAKSYTDQTDQINELLKEIIPNSTEEDIQNFYYPLAINEIRKLAIKSDLQERKVSASDFIANINVKNKLFNDWQIAYLNEDKYIKYINNKYFKSTNATSILKAARFFVINHDNSLSASEYKDVIKKISDKYSNKEFQRTNEKERFCPYLLVHGISDLSLIDLKKQLKLMSIIFIDGFGFKGADFDIERVCATPLKNNKLKILNSIEEFKSALNYPHHQALEVFEFYKAHPIDKLVINDNAKHNQIKISTLASIKEMIK